MIYSVCPQRERSVQTTDPSPWTKLCERNKLILSWIWFFSNEIINSQKQNALKLDTISYFQPLLSETNTAARVRGYRICKPSESQNKLNTVRKQRISFVLWEKKEYVWRMTVTVELFIYWDLGVTVFAVILHWV